MIFQSEVGGPLLSAIPLDIMMSDKTDKPDVSLLQFQPIEIPRKGSAARDVKANEATREASALKAAARAEANEAVSVQHAFALESAIEQARAEGRQEARIEAQEEIDAQVGEVRKKVSHVCADFMRDRQRYFAGAEEQVVKLALAIAARVLHRESMMDPLLLAGAVRVAIAKVEESSAVSLRVLPAEVDLWRSEFPPESKPVIEVLGDERLTPGELVLETVVGRVELGVGVQLEEIEQGFFDLLQRRPT